MASNFEQYLHQFTDYYKKSLSRRIIIGLICGFLVWGILLIFSLIMKQVFRDIYFQTLFNDVPGIGFIFGFVLTLEIWGLIPRPSPDITEDPNKDDKINEEDIPE